jgi:hypothetical protein
MFMKKTFLLLLTVMLAFGMTLVSCGGDDEGPSTYTVTFIDGDTTLKTIGKILPGKTLKEVATLGDYDSVEKIDAALEDVLSPTEYTVKEGWFDQDGNRVTADTPISKSLTVTPKFTPIPEADAIAIDSADVDIPAFDLTLSHISENPADRASAYKYFRITGNLTANHVYEISFAYDIKKKGTTDAATFRAIGVQASFDRYSDGVSWWNDPAVSTGNYTTKVVNKDKAVIEKSKTALKDKAFKFVIDNSTNVAVGDEITVTITDLTITDLGEQVNVVFNANGGTDEDVSVAVNKGDAVSFFDIPTFTNTGKYLKGWSTDISGTPQVDPYYEELNTDVTYYAIWVNAAEEEGGYWVKQLGTDLAQGIDLSDYPEDAYIEFVFPTYPFNDGIGAISEEWTGWETINSPSSNIGEFRPRYLIKTLKAKATALGKSTLVNLVGNWKSSSNQSSTAINLITFNGPAPTILTIGTNGEWGYQVTIPPPDGIANGKTYTLTYTFTLNKQVSTLQVVALNSSWSATSEYLRLQDYDRVTPAPDANGIYAANTEYTGSLDMAITEDGTDKIAITSALLDGEITASADNAAKIVFSVMTMKEKVVE